MRLLGRKQFSAAPGITIRQYFEDRWSLCVLGFLLIFSVSCFAAGYLIGKTDNSEGFKGYLGDTILIIAGEEGEEASDASRIDIRGRVLYRSGEPFQNGTVELKSEPRYTTTDSLGRFFFDSVVIGRHTISVIQNGTILASCEIFLERTAEINDAQIIRLPDGSYFLQYALDIKEIELTFELFEGTLSVTLVPRGKPEADSAAGLIEPNEPETPEGENGEPPRDPDEPEGDQPSNEPDAPGSEGEPGEPDDASGGSSDGDSSGGGSSGGGSSGGEEEEDTPPSVSVTDTIAPSQVWNTSTPVDIFGQREGSSGVFAIGGDSVIAPGSYGSYEFRIKNMEATTIQYKISLRETDGNTPKLPMKYRLKTHAGGSYLGGSGWKSAEEIETAFTSLDPLDFVYYTLEWKWESTDTGIDTAIGIQEDSPYYILDIVVRAQYE